MRVGGRSPLSVLCFFVRSRSGGSSRPLPRLRRGPLNLAFLPKANVLFFFFFSFFFFFIIFFIAPCAIVVGTRFFSKFDEHLPFCRNG